jgi:hypothetical protein
MTMLRMKSLSISKLTAMKSSCIFFNIKNTKLIEIERFKIDKIKLGGNKIPSGTNGAVTDFRQTRIFFVFCYIFFYIRLVFRDSYERMEI